MNCVEIWRDIPGFETKYEVSNFGNVRGLPRHTGHQRIKGKTLKPFQSDCGYFYVNLCRKNNPKHTAIHRLVCQVFHGNAPEGCTDVNHKDGNKSNNFAGNLEWMTRPANQLHAADIGLKPHGEESHLSKLTLAQVQEIRALKGTMSQRKIADRFSVSQTCISKIFRNVKWRNN